MNKRYLLLNQHVHTHSTLIMLQQVTKIASSPSTVQRLAKTLTSHAVKNSVTKSMSGNSFHSFKEYRENAKTYGPLSASLASRRHLTDMHKC